MKKKPSRKPRKAVILKREAIKLTPKELAFVRAYAETGSYTDAAKIAYPDVELSGSYGSDVAERPHIRPLIERIKQKIIGDLDDAYIHRKYKEIIDKTAFQKIVLRTERETPLGVYEELREVDQTPIALQALNGIAKFKRSAEQSLGNVNIQVNIDSSLLGENERVVDVTPKE